MKKKLEDLSDNQFWKQVAYESKELAKKYPELTAERKVYNYGNGEWDLVGPEFACHRFSDIAEACARRMGFTGSRLSAVQFWLDHLHGEHAAQNEAAGNKIQDTEAIVTMANGQREGYKGRQKI